MARKKQRVVERIVLVPAQPWQSVRYVEVQDFRSDVQKAADRRVAAATAREQHWLAWDEPWESDPTRWQRVAVIFQGTNQEEALRGLEGAGRIRNLRHEDGAGAPWRATKDRLPLPDSGGRDGEPKGVSLHDVALVLNEGEPGPAREMLRRWKNNRKFTPASIGIDPGHGQRKLYAPVAILAYLQKIGEYLPMTQTQALQRLTAKLRSPR